MGCNLGRIAFAQVDLFFNVPLINRVLGVPLQFAPLGFSGRSRHSTLNPSCSSSSTASFFFCFVEGQSPFNPLSFFVSRVYFRPLTLAVGCMMHEPAEQSPKKGAWPAGSFLCCCFSHALLFGIFFTQYLLVSHLAHPLAMLCRMGIQSLREGFLLHACDVPLLTLRGGQEAGDAVLGERSAYV